MKFVCDRCQTKYSIADEKVRGKILKVRCKSCSNIITVREEPAPGVRRPSAANHPVGAHGQRPAAPPMARPPVAPAERPHGTAPAPPVHRPTPPDDGLEWYVALDGNRTGPFHRKQVVDKVAALPKDADLHVWNEQLGSWKAPADVPAIAADLAARRNVAGPPPFPGAPRRPTQPPMVPVGGPAPARSPTGPDAVASALGAGGTTKLPLPGGQPGGRRVTGPVPALAASAASAASDPATEDLDDGPTSLLDTTGADAHVLRGLTGPNGSSHGIVASNGSPGGDHSDVLNTFNLAADLGATATGADAAPRLLPSETLVDWQSATSGTPAARQRSARIVLVFLSVIAVICAVFILNAMKKTKPMPAPASAPKVPAAVEPTDPLAAAAAKAAATPAPTTPREAVAPSAPAAEPSGHGKGKIRGAHGHANPAAKTLASNGPLAAGQPAAAAAPDPNARYRDTSRPSLAIGGGGAARPAPSQADISRVINNNRGGIKTCYQRALLRDNSLTHGKITVQLTIGISGRVKRASIDGPPQFRALDPCIKEVVGRWVFPQGPDEYGTEFAYLFQGNE